MSSDETREGVSAPSSTPALPEGNAIVYCEGAFLTPNGKTAHGLVRFTRRYRVLAVIDSTCEGGDAGEILDRKPAGIPVVKDLHTAISQFVGTEHPPTHFVIGLAPDGGRLPEAAKADVKFALQHGLHVDSGLHDFLSEDKEIAELAEKMGRTIRDVRKPPPRSKLHFFSGKIEQVSCLKIALLGTDSAVGKRTTAWKLVHAFEAQGMRAEMIGTGQTGWMQGARFSLVLDSLVNDFVSGEIEHAVWSAWNEVRPDAIVIEGQGSLMNPAYPGGFEILAAGRPDVVILQHAPARKEYDGFPGYPLHPLAKQIQVLEALSGVPVVAITLNHEDLVPEEIPFICRAIEQTVGLPTVDVLTQSAAPLVAALAPYLEARRLAGARS